jgi:hypothetical protein
MILGNCAYRITEICEVVQGTWHKAQGARLKENTY